MANIEIEKGKILAQEYKKLEERFREGNDEKDDIQDQFIKAQANISGLQLKLDERTREMSEKLNKLKEEHRIEVNEIEQKISKERLQA